MDAQSNPRYHMWNRLLGPNSTREARQSYADTRGYDLEPSDEDYENAMNYPTTTATAAIEFYNYDLTLGGFKIPEQVRTISNCTIYNGPNKEDDMYHDTYNKEETQVAHLEERLNEIRDAKRMELMEDFFINADPPETVGELRDRLATGKFLFNNNKRTDDFKLGYVDLDNWVSWRTVPADHDGFEKARDAMYAAAKDTEDQFLIDYKTGLEALKAFEGTTFH